MSLWFKLKSYSISITLFLVWIMAFHLLYLQFYPIQPLVTYDPFEVADKEVAAGDYLEFKVDFCKLKSYPSIVTVELVNDVHLLLGSLPSDEALGCRQYNVLRHIPKGVHPGKYHLKFTARYDILPTRHIVHEYKTEDFWIVEGEE